MPVHISQKGTEVTFTKTFWRCFFLESGVLGQTSRTLDMSLCPDTEILQGFGPSLRNLHVIILEVKIAFREWELCFW